MLLIVTGTKKVDDANTSDEEDDKKLGEEGEKDGQWKQVIEKVNANTRNKICNDLICAGGAGEVHKDPAN